MLVCITDPYPQTVCHIDEHMTWFKIRLTDHIGWRNILTFAD
jgi:hypothetical protein